MKNYKKTMAIVVILLVIVAISFQMYSFKRIESELVSENILSQSENVQKSYVSYKSSLCKFDLLKPEYAFISYLHYVYPEDNIDRESWNVGFYEATRSMPFSYNWTLNYKGGTNIENATFDEIVAMVKEDCSQFQQSKGDYWDETINWSYSAYEPEPELTEEEKQKAEEEYIISRLQGELVIYNEEDLKYVEETYGITRESPPWDLLEWYEKGLEDGFFLEPFSD